MNIVRRLTLLMALATVGCASIHTVKFTPAAAPNSNDSLVYIYRMTGQEGTWVPSRLTFNDLEAARLPNMTSFRAYVKSGPLVIKAFIRDSIVRENDGASIEISRELIPGRTHYFKIEGTETLENRNGQWYGRFERIIKEVGAEQAAREMATLEMIANQ